ncbi:MAG: hypothetical protein HY053_09320 [Proteobacteria bacterium]|nr:hypothetical protein [Pseudomonadota bacterium]
MAKAARKTAAKPTEAQQYAELVSTLSSRMDEQGVGRSALQFIVRRDDIAMLFRLAGRAVQTYARTNQHPVSAATAKLLEQNLFDTSALIRSAHVSDSERMVDWAVPGRPIPMEDFLETVKANLATITQLRMHAEIHRPRGSEGPVFLSIAHKALREAARHTKRCTEGANVCFTFA